MLQILLISLFVEAILSAGCGSQTPDYGDPNNYPIADGLANMKLVNQISNGKLYSVTVPNDGGNSVSTFDLIHVYGTPYEMGLAQGKLLRNTTEFLNRVWKYFEETVEKVLPTLPPWLAQLISDIGLDLALDGTYEATRYWTNPEIFEEMRGVSDGAGVNFNTILRIHMIAGLTEGKCSMFGAFGPALDPTSSTKLLQLRSLDWDMDGPFRDYPSITIYHPNKGKGYAHANVGMAGFIGGLTGMNENGLAISEIGVAYPDESFGAESRIGVPFIFLLRDILYHDNTIDDATLRIAMTRRTCDLILGVGDGKLTEFKGYKYSYSDIKVVNDVDLIPYNETWHPRMSGLVYWGMDWVCPSYNLVLSQQLKKYYGKLTPEIAIKYTTSVEKSGDNHLAFYDLTNMVMYVAFAAQHNVGGKVEAYNRQFTKFDVKKLFNEPKPQI